MADKFKRVLSLDVEVQFDQSSGKIHQNRLNEIRTAALEAIEAAVAEQFPEIPAEIKARMTWTYLYREENQSYEVGLDLDPDNGN